jgi:hypothetical protein
MLPGRYFEPRRHEEHEGNKILFFVLFVPSWLISMLVRKPAGNLNQETYEEPHAKTG